MDHNSVSPRSLSLIALLMALAIALSATSRPAAPAAAQEPLPDGAALLFISNVGQFDAAARYQLRTSGATVWLADDAIWLSVLEPPPAPTRPTDAIRPADGLDPAGPRRGANIRLSFSGATPTPPTGFAPQEATVSYLLGDDQSRRRTNVPVLGGVRYANLYPGLDLVLIGDGGRLAPRLVCSADDCAAALADVRLKIEGADRVTIDGDLIRLATAAGEVTLPLLEAVDADGEPLAVDLAAAVVDGAGDAAEVVRPIVAAEPPIDQPDQGQEGTAPAAAGEWPEIFYSTYLGGGRLDFIHDIAADADGNAYLTGSTESADYPLTPGAFVQAEGTTDLFITKLAPDGNRLVYSALVGGSNQDIALAISVSGSAVTVGGTTNSNDFPTTTNALDRVCNDSGCPGGPDEGDAILVRLNAAGNDLLYSTYLGGRGHDEIRAIGLQSTAVVMAGVTSSDNFPVSAAAYDKTYADAEVYDYEGDGFAARLVPGATSLAYSTYFGGTYLEDVRDMAVSSDGTATIVGATMAADFPTTDGAFDRQHAGSGNCGDYEPLSCLDAFVLRLNSSGAALVYSTFLGGVDQADGVDAVAVNQQGDAFLAGTTSSDDFPVTAGAFDISHGSGGEDDCDYEACSDVFVTRLNTTGSRLVYSTFLGGSGEYLYDTAEDISIDAGGLATVVGFTQSPNFPVTAGAFATPCETCIEGDGFLTRVNAAATGLSYSTLYGGSDFDTLRSIASVATGDWVVAGMTYSADFPTTPGALDIARGGPTDGVVARLQISPQVAAANWPAIGQNGASSSGLSNTLGESSAPAAAVGPDGSIYVAWTDKTPGNAEIYVRRWNGAAWVEVGSGSATGGGISANSGESVAPDIAATTSGVIVVWSDTTKGNAEIYAKEWNGTAWRELAGSATGGGISANSGESTFPSVDVSGKGPAVTWADTTPGKADIYIKLWDGKAWKEMGSGSATGGGISRNSGDSVQPAIAHDSKGLPLVAWTDNSTGDTEIYVKRFSGSKWIVAGSNSASGGGISNNSGLSRGVALAAATSGKIVAAWADESGGNLEIYAREWDGKAWREIGAGSASGRGISLSPGASQGATVAIGADGRPAIGWYDTSAGNSEIFIRRWTGTRWAEIKAGSARGGGVSDDLGASSQPDLVYADGIPALVWGDATSGKYQIYARRSETPVVSCYTLTLSRTGQGAVPVASPLQSPACTAGKYVAGETITLTAAPSQGYQVSGWQGTTNNTSTALTNTVVMPGNNHNASVTYAAIAPTCYTLSLSRTGQGAVPVASPMQSPGCSSGKYVAGETIALTAAPAQGQQVSGWQGTTNNTSTALTNTVLMPAAAHSASVAYAPVAPTCYTLTLSHAGEGSDPTAAPTQSSGCEPGKYVQGASITLTARPADGWRVVSWSGTSNDAVATNQNTLTMPPSNRTVVVTYETIGVTCYQLAMQFTGLGDFPLAAPASSAGCAPGRYVAGEVVNLLARPASGWQLGGWRGTDNDSSSAGLNRVTMTAEDHLTLARYRPSGTRRVIMMPMVSDNAD